MDDDWPNTASLVAQLRQRDTTSRGRYGCAPVSEWPRTQDRPLSQVLHLSDMSVATDREMQLHAKEIARLQDAQRRWRHR